LSKTNQGKTAIIAAMKLRVAHISVMVSALTLALLTAPASLAAAKDFTIGGDRPTLVHMPSKLSTPAPLLIMLHSYSTSGAHQERYMKLGPVAKKAGLIYIAPDGNIDAAGKRFWNASKSCCDKYGQNPDDVAYIDSLIAEINEKTPVDPERIYLIGHSNGAFMSLAYACATNKVAAIVTLAGAMDTDAECSPTTPTALLNIHGTADATIKINGGVLNTFPYTSAAQTNEKFTTVNQCTNPATKKKKDFDPSLKGSETSVFTYTCATGAPVQFWQVKDGLHSPRLPKDYAQQVITFLTQQTKRS
jgi:polyhydroxybutyrate depolymerase